MMVYWDNQLLINGTKREVEAEFRALMCWMHGMLMQYNSEMETDEAKEILHKLLDEAIARKGEKTLC